LKLNLAFGCDSGEESVKNLRWRKFSLFSFGHGRLTMRGGQQSVGCASGPDLLGFTGLEHAVRMKETDWGALSKMEKRRKGWTRRLGLALCFAGKEELEKKRKGIWASWEFRPKKLGGKGKSVLILNCYKMQTYLNSNQA
jgi:hypothetical protein